MPILKKEVVDEDVLTLALERVNHVYDLFDHVAVSFSGGKDSTAVFNLALQVARERNRLPLRVFHFDEEAIPLDVEDYLRRMAQMPDVEIEWYCVPLKHANACDPANPYWYPWALEDEDKWCRPLPPEAITQIKGYDSSKPETRLSIPEIVHHLFPPSLGRCCMLLGIRADESMTRYKAVAHRTEENYLMRHSGSFGGSKVTRTPHLFKAYPIYDWTTDDVWTAPKLLKWDYCRFYDLLEMAKIPHSQQRLAPPFGSEPFKALPQYAKTYPELWEKMTARVSGANTAALYSKTALYGFGDLPKKPDGMEWEDFLKQQILKHDKSLQKIIVKRIRGEIRKHYKKTSDPILEEVGHYYTGISWKFLLMLATRGDAKERRTVIDNKDTKEKYDAARAEYESGLTDGGTRY
jgi:predicted phosphoadenosine phosphosulfate sulfurtransferase